MKYETYFVFIILFLCVSFNLKAEPHKEHHDHGNQSAHVHGLASLTLAIENNELEIELNSPAVDLVGFEHRANSLEEKSMVEKTEALLHSPEKIFSFKGSKCKAKEINIDTSDVTAIKNKHHAHDEHEHHDSDRHNQDHSEVTAHYHFSCDKTNNLTTVVVNLFEHFPTLENINSMWVTEIQQGAAMLNKDKNIINIK